MESVFSETNYSGEHKGFFYKIPSEWKWTLLGDISDITIGKSPKGCYTTTESAYTGLIGGASDMGEQTPNITRYTRKPVYLCQKDDIIVAVRATIGKVNISDGEYCIGRGVARIHSEQLNSQFLMYYLSYAKEYFESVATESTFKQVSVKDLRNMPIPVPPLQEQEYISRKITDSFAKLNLASEFVENAKKELENLHSYFLIEAFSGKLTESWRKERGITKQSWQKRKFYDVAEVNIVARKKSDCEKEDIPYITAGNIERKTGRLLACGKLKGKNENSIKYSFSKNEILYVRNNPELSRIIIADFDGACSLEVFPIKAKENEKFLWYYMLSDYFLRELLNVNPSLSRVNRGHLERMEVCMPDRREQAEIVRLLDSFFEKEKKIYERMNEMDEVEKMKEAILAKAFHGEL